MNTIFILENSVDYTSELISIDKTQYNDIGFTSENDNINLINPAKDVMFNVLLYKDCNGEDITIDYSIKTIIPIENDTPIINDYNFTLENDGFYEYYVFGVISKQRMLDNWNSLPNKKILFSENGKVYELLEGSTSLNVLSEEFDLLTAIKEKGIEYWATTNISFSQNFILSLYKLKNCKNNLTLDLLKFMRYNNCNVTNYSKYKNNLKNVQLNIDYLDMSITALEYMYDLKMYCEINEFLKYNLQCLDFCDNL